VKRYFRYSPDPEKPLYIVITDETPKGLVWRGEFWEEVESSRVIEMLLGGEVFLDEIPETELPETVKPFEPAS